MRRREFCSGLLALPALMRSAMAQEVSKVLLVKQHGLPYLPLMVMEELKLVEKHAAKLGIPGLTPDYRTLGGTTSLVDALLAGQMHGGVTGVPGLLTLWDKTVGTANEVRALCAVQSMPFLLVTNKPGIKSIRDFTAQDKIAVPGVKVSAQAICLQMAAAKEWGEDQYDKLDPLTITRPHPDAATAIIAKSSELTAHYSPAPYYQYELAAPGTHSILRSYDTFGGHVTNGVLIMSKKFHDANPKACAAIYAAVEDACAFIAKNPKQSAQFYLTMTGEKRSSLDELTGMVADMDVDWTTIPDKSMQYFTFMHKVGTLKKQPGSWKDFYMPEVHGLAGS